MDIAPVPPYSRGYKNGCACRKVFGNMLSGDMIAIILLGIVGLLVPIPFSLLHIIIGIIQAYIFGVLTLVFIAGGIKTKS